MTVRAHAARVRTAGRLARRLGLDANPLRRPSDKVEAFIRLGLLLLFLIGGPLATIGAGHWMKNADRREERAQAQAEHRVRAVLLQNASSFAVYGEYLATWVPARWAAPGGSSRTGAVSAAPGARAGSTVTIWTTASGQLADPPRSQDQITGQLILCNALTPAVLAMMLLGLARLSRQMLDRQRVAKWDAAWSAVEPQWTHPNQ